MEANTIQKYAKYSTSELLKRAQTIFNRYIRERDKDLTCISCGSWANAQAGHYMSAGHHSALRFNENNVHRQCAKCNTFLHGNLINYRKGLIKRIGEEKVRELEDTPRISHKWDRFELIHIIETYKQKIKSL